jgi:anti-sigma factor RsiW
MTNGSPPEDLLLHALADGELDAATAFSLETRIASDPLLAAEYARIMALKERSKSLGKPSVSPDFAARIAAIAAPHASTASKPKRLSFDHPSWRALAASVMVTAFLASGGTYLVTSSRNDTSIEDAIANGHRRSLLAASPIDVVSSDKHTVKPWFDQKLGLSPPTVDLSAEGFLLMGGRVEVVSGEPLPSLVYRRRQHLISVIAQPLKTGATPSAAPSAKIVDGYNMIEWAGDGFAYWAISDLDMTELHEFVDDFRKP